MAFTKYDITVKQGEDFRLSFTVEMPAGSALDVSGYTWAGKIRRAFADVASLVDFSFDTSSAASGIIVAQLTDTQTAALTATSTLSAREREDNNFAVYDIEGTDGSGIIRRYLEGRVVLSLEATK